MGLPQAQLKRKAELMAKEGQGPIAKTESPNVLSFVPTAPIAELKPVPAPEQPVVQQVPTEPSPVPQATQTPQEPEINWREEAEQNLRRWKALQGQYDAKDAERDAAIKKAAELEAEVQRLTEMQKAIKQAEEEQEDKYTDQEMSTYGQSLEVIGKTANIKLKPQIRALKDELKELKNQIAELKSNQQVITKDLANSTEQQFASAIRSVVSDFDSLISSPKWEPFLQQQIPYTNFTLGQALSAAHESRNLDKVAEILNGFKKSIAASASALGSMTAPNLNGGGPILNQGTKPMLKLSDRKRASEDFRKGRLSKADLDKVVAHFADAEKEGRVDYNS